MAAATYGNENLAVVRRGINWGAVWGGHHSDCDVCGRTCYRPSRGGYNQASRRRSRPGDVWLVGGRSASPGNSGERRTDDSGNH